MMLKRVSLLAAAVALALVELPAAQMRVRPIDLEDGSVALGLVLRHLANTGVFMQATAHPDVVHGMNPTGTAGGLHHQSSGLLSREAFKAAGDPTRYPEQLREGLRPWQARKFYYPSGGPGAGGGRGQPAPPSPPSGGPLPLG